MPASNGGETGAGQVLFCPSNSFDSAAPRPGARKDFRGRSYSAH